MSFLPIPGFSNYRISSDGVVKSLSRKVKCGKYGKKTTKETILKSCVSRNGYPTAVLISDNGKKKTKYVHRLVAESFLDNKNNENCVNHKDGDKLNNCLENLEWCSYKENTLHAFKNNLMNPKKCFGEENHQSKIKKHQVLKIRKLKGKELLKETAEKFDISVSQVWSIQNKVSWSHI